MKDYVQKLDALFKTIQESDGITLYHGSNSPKLEGELRMNERDSGWFGTGFYLTAYPEYAKRWGEYVHRLTIPDGKYAKVLCSDGYNKIEYIGDAKKASDMAGGSAAWIENEEEWSVNFTDNLRSMGYIGVRVDMDRYPDVEVVIFDPSIISVE